MQIVHTVFVVSTYAFGQWRLRGIAAAVAGVRGLGSGFAGGFETAGALGKWAPLVFASVLDAEPACPIQSLGITSRVGQRVL